MQHEAEAATQRALSAGTLPDPVFRIELDDITNAGSPAGPSLLPWRVGSTKYRLMQPIPFPGKLRLQQSVARAEAEQADRRAASAWIEVAARIRSEHAQHWYLVRNQRLIEELIDVTASLESIATARYAGGLVAQQDAIRAQLERTVLRTELATMLGERRRVHARLNALLSRSSTAPLPEPEAPAPLAELSLPASETLIGRALESNTELAAEGARLRAAQANRELTYLNRHPDFMLGVMPVQMSTRITMWGLMLEMQVPLQQSSRRAQERAAESDVAAVRERNQALSNQIKADIEAGLAALQVAQQTEALAQTHLLPQAQLAVQASMAAYETGRVDFATVLDAQRELRKARQMLLRARLDGHLRLAELERLVGGAP